MTALIMTAVMQPLLLRRRLRSARCGPSTRCWAWARSAVAAVQAGQLRPHPHLRWRAASMEAAAAAAGALWELEAQVHHLLPELLALLEPGLMRELVQRQAITVLTVQLTTATMAMQRQAITAQLITARQPQLTLRASHLHPPHYQARSDSHSRRPRQLQRLPLRLARALHRSASDVQPLLLWATLELLMPLALLPGCPQARLARPGVSAQVTVQALLVGRALQHSMGAGLHSGHRSPECRCLHHYRRICWRRCQPLRLQHRGNRGSSCTRTRTRSLRRS